MAMNMEREKAQQKELKKKKGFGWKPTSGLEGGNVIRVLPFEHKVTKDDVAEGNFDRAELGKTVTTWRRLTTTYYKGTAQEKLLLNIVDLTNKSGDKAVETWVAPKSAAVAIGDYVYDEDYGESVLGCKGRDFKVHYDKDAKAQDMYKVTIRDEKLCKEIDSELEEKVLDFYDPEVYEKFKQEPEGGVAGDEPEKEERSNGKKKSDELE